jgi:hypothetical protein
MANFAGDAEVHDSGGTEEREKMAISGALY